jgi:hypothetical protein
MGMSWSRLVACLWLSVLVLSCAKKPAIDRDLVIAGLTDSKTGKVNAGDLGWATMTDLRIEEPEVQGNKAIVLARVKAEQDKQDVLYKLSATLRLRYEWERRTWVLKKLDEITPWVARGPREPRPYTQEMDEGGDSAAIQGLLKAKKLIRRQLNEIPYGP